MRYVRKEQGVRNTCCGTLTRTLRMPEVRRAKTRFGRVVLDRRARLDAADPACGAGPARVRIAKDGVACDPLGPHATPSWAG